MAVFTIIKAFIDQHPLRGLFLILFFVGSSNRLFPLLDEGERKRDATREKFPEVWVSPSLHHRLYGDKVWSQNPGKP